MEFEYIKSNYPFSKDSLNKLANRKMNSMTFQRCINIFGLTPAVNYYNKNILKLKSSTLKYKKLIKNKNFFNNEFQFSLEKIIKNININHKTEIEENFSKFNNKGIINFNRKNFNYGRFRYSTR